MGTRRARRDDTRVVRRLKQLRALRSPLRQDIVFVLESTGPSAVSDLAARLGKSTHALYYHVRALEEAGLVRVHGHRSTGRREEVVYDLVSKGIVIDPRQRSRAFLEALGEMYAATLRRTEREIVRSMKGERRTPPGEPRRAGLFTVNARLTARSWKLVREQLLALGELIEAEDDPSGEAAVLTVAFHPAAPSKSKD